MSSNAPDHDAFDISQELDTIQKRLKELDVQQQEALLAYRDARYNLLVADTKLRGIKAEIDVAKARSINLMSILRSLPK